jgi:hypothetical protein
MNMPSSPRSFRLFGLLGRPGQLLLAGLLGLILIASGGVS